MCGEKNVNMLVDCLRVVSYSESVIYTRTKIELELIRSYQLQFFAILPCYYQEKMMLNDPCFHVSKEIVREIRKLCTRWAFSFAR